MASNTDLAGGHDQELAAGKRLGVAPQHGTEALECTAPGCLDNRLRYAARLKVSPCLTARIWAGLRWPFFSISHSAL